MEFPNDEELLVRINSRYRVVSDSGQPYRNIDTTPAPHTDLMRRWRLSRVIQRSRKS